MKKSLEQVKAEYQRELEEEQARLIEDGVSPWIAMGEAMENIKRRRQAKTVCRQIKSKD